MLHSNEKISAYKYKKKEHKQTKFWFPTLTKGKKFSRHYYAYLPSFAMD